MTNCCATSALETTVFSYSNESDRIYYRNFGNLSGDGTGNSKSSASESDRVSSDSDGISDSGVGSDSDSDSDTNLNFRGGRSQRGPRRVLRLKTLDGYQRLEFNPTSLEKSVCILSSIILCFVPLV